LASLAALWMAFAVGVAAGRSGSDTGGLPLDACIARMAPGDTPARMFTDQPRYDCTAEQHLSGPGDYWVLSAPVAQAARQPALRVRVASLWQRGLALHALYADGKVAVLRDTSATLSRRIQLGAIVEYAVPVRDVPVVRLLWRVDGAANARGVLLNQHLMTPTASARSNVLMAAIFAAFAGLATGLLIYNLALWGALRHRFQLAYCAMVVGLLAYALSSSGALAWLAPGIDNNDRLRWNYISLGLVVAAAVMFARTFFEPRVFAGWLGRLTAAAMIILSSSGALFAVAAGTSMATADAVFSCMLLAGLSVAAPILWGAWTSGSRHLRLFAIAWAAPIVFAGARILAAVHVLPNGFWMDNSTVLSMGAEALLTSLAIAHRVQMLSRERDRALAGETVARELADIDPLTGLFNRRAFLARALGRDGPHILHVIDIDHFKGVNDTLGHDGGDEVLRVIARTLRAGTPPGALTARIGGEEFAILTDTRSTLDPESILAGLRAARMPFDLSVTASIGTCTGPLTSETEWKTLYRDADRALFAAKSDGRDRARTAPALAYAA
jgi:diguanylate cyclase (GGDEF)-like protein